MQIKIDHTTLSGAPELGLYQIGGKTFKDKASAVLEGTKMGLKYKDLYWNFNDIDYSSWDWTQEPPGSIREYYHARARHLREKYDYIIINCSGGADSTTVLYSFIQQGLFVDEVFVRRAGVGVNYKSSDTEFDASNEFSEYEYAALPLLKWLKSISPKTKITVHDFSADLLNDKMTWDENFIYWCGDYVTPGCVVRYTHASDKDSLNVFDTGKRVCILFGTDKPKLSIAPDGNLLTYFADRTVSSAIPATVNNGYDNTYVELFYWSPDAVPLMIKQCHILKRWFEMPENKRLQYMLNPSWQMNAMNRTMYESVIKGIIYPDYDLTTFQCNKPVKLVFQEWDYWMLDHKNSEGYNTFMRGLNYLYNNVDKDFFKVPDLGIMDNKMNPLNWEYKICTSKYYNIGKMNSVGF